MLPTPAEGADGTHGLPRIGRWIATIYAAFFGLLLAVEAFHPQAGQIEEGDEWEAVAVGTLVAAAMAAVALCWRFRSLTFSLMLVVGLYGTAVGVATAGHNHWLAALVAGGPYLLAAALTWLGRGCVRDEPVTGRRPSSQ